MFMYDSFANIKSLYKVPRQSTSASCFSLPDAILESNETKLTVDPIQLISIVIIQKGLKFWTDLEHKQCENQSFMTKLYKTESFNLKIAI